MSGQGSVPEDQRFCVHVQSTPVIKILELKKDQFRFRHPGTGRSVPQGPPDVAS